MGRVVKKVLLIFLAVIVLAVVVAAIVFRPYYKMPDVDQKMLEGKLEAWQALAAEVENRSTTDRNAMGKLLKEHRAFLRTDLKWSNGCPPFNREKIAERTDEIEQKIAIFDKQLTAILADGFVLQRSFDATADYLPLADFMRVIKYELIYLIQEVDKEQYVQATDRWLRLANLSDGLANTPALLYQMFYVSTQKAMLPVLDCVKSSLPSEQIERLVARLEHRPDSEKQFINAVRIELSYMQGLFAKEQAVHSNYPKPLIWLADITGYLNRERIFLLSLGDRQLAEFERWLSSGRQVKPSEVITGKELRYSLLASMAWPNFPKLFEKVIEEEQKQEETLTSLRAELSKRQDESL